MPRTRIPRRCTHQLPFTRWSQDKNTPADFGPQPPAEELLGEHHLMGLVFDAMVIEARQSEEGAGVRLEFWRDAVDFIGNFVHRCHRAKEDRFFFPVLVRAEILDEESLTTPENSHEARRLTLGIRDAAKSGDWARVFQLVPEYVIFMRHHMMGEERDLLQPYARSVGIRVQDEIMAGFLEVEKKVLAKRDRQSYIELARRLCDMTGVEHGL